MTRDQIAALAASGKSETLKSKQCREATRTMCAFLNQYGGQVLFGVDAGHCGWAAGERAHDRGVGCAYHGQRLLSGWERRAGDVPSQLQPDALRADAKRGWLEESARRRPRHHFMALHAEEGKNMSNGFRPVFTTTHPITGALTHIERARGFLEAAMLSEQWVREMGQRALLLEAHHTTHIEGTRLTLDQSRRLLEGSPVPDADPEDAKELLNYRKAFDFVSKYLAGGGPITEGLIREIHRHLVEGVRGGAAGPGEYRKIQNYVVNSLTEEIIYEPPPAFDVPIMMAELVHWLHRQQEVHPVLVSGIAQFPTRPYPSVSGR